MIRIFVEILEPALVQDAAYGVVVVTTGGLRLIRAAEFPLSLDEAV